MNKQPHLSVILPVYEVPERWFVQAVESILIQTYSYFELIIVLDNPDSARFESIISEYQKKDNRLVLIKNHKNIGLPKSLNKAIRIAKGKFIARMDADDISEPHRFETQINYLEENPSISLCGGQAMKIDFEGNEIGCTQNALEFDLIKKLIPIINPVTHPTWMIRKKDMFDVGLYRNLPNAEDHDLVARLITENKKIANLPEVLIRYRMHFGSQSGKKSIEQKLCFKYIQKLHRQRIMNGVDSFDEEKLYEYLKVNNPNNSRIQNGLWAARIKGANMGFMKLFYVIRSFLFSRIERSYLIDLFRARIIKLFYSLNAL